jgi:four helix bundle protein
VVQKFKGFKCSRYFGAELQKQQEVYMPVKAFEAMEVWKEARRLTQRIYDLTKKGEFSKDFGLSNQIRKAAVSIMSNIAEGFERGGNHEFVQFLYIAKGSCGEVRSQICGSRSELRDEHRS